MDEIDREIETISRQDRGDILKMNELADLLINRLKKCREELNVNKPLQKVDMMRERAVIKIDLTTKQMMGQKENER